MKRRKTFSDTSVMYGAVGCTQAADVMLYPPTDFRPTLDEQRLGSGAERFEVATDALMSWGVPRGAHLRILQVSESEAAGYEPLLFNDFDRPVSSPEDISTAPGEALYAADGSPYVMAGQSLEVSGVFSPASGTHTYRVIYVIREPRRVGYAWGTLDVAPVVGEEYFGVEWREDDSVVAILRTVTQVAPGRMRAVVTPFIRFRQWMLRRQYIRALLPVRGV